MTRKPSTALDGAFRLVNAAVLPGWLLMIFAPHSRWTQRVITNDAFFIGMGGIYVTMLVGAAQETPAGAQNMFNPTLSNIHNLFKNGGYRGTFAGWTHYLVFDLFVGRTIFQDAQRRNIPHALLVPALGLTFITGPLGLMYYRILLRLRGEQ